MRGSPAFFPLTLALAVAAFCAALFAQAGPAVPVYQIVVHANNPAGIVDRSFLEDAFLKKVTTWPTGETIRPVDLASNSSVRRKFTDDVLRRSVEAVKGYWQQRIFSGRDVPPPELDGDDDVIKYVLKYEGAVGYVSGGANLNGSKVLSVR
jgi:ABC-type phosphate transport system substrate-binding protein